MMPALERVQSKARFRPSRASSAPNAEDRSACAPRSCLFQLPGTKRCPRLGLRRGRQRLGSCGFGTSRLEAKLPTACRKLAFFNRQRAKRQWLCGMAPGETSNPRRQGHHRAGSESSITKTAWRHWAVPSSVSNRSARIVSPGVPVVPATRMRASGSWRAEPTTLPMRS